MSLPNQVLMPLKWLLDVGNYLKARPIEDKEASDLYLAIENKVKSLLEREAYAERLRQTEKESQ